MNSISKNILVHKEMMKLLMNEYSQNTNSLSTTHVSMGDVRGKYSFNRSGTEKLFSLCANHKGTEGLAEMPQAYSMLRFDFDYEEETTSKTPYPLFHTDIFLNTIIPSIQTYLSENLTDFKPEHADCCLLTKTPYIKDNVLKHGLHLQFINTFVHKKDFKIIEQKFKHLNGIDIGMSTKPWLCYNQSKARGKGSYQADTVLTHDGILVPAEDYFESYEVFDDREIKIKFTQPIQYYYPRIFSIKPYNRPVVELAVEMESCDSLVTVWDDCDDEVQEYSEEIRNIVEEYVNDSENCFDIKDWKGNFLTLKRIKSYLCPTTESREHDNRDAYVRLNKKKGQVCIGCFCNEGRSAPIGTYKTVQTTEKEPDTEGLNLECQEASFVYQRYNKSSKMNYDGKSYGEIATIDRDFAVWICDNIVHPHARIFSKILNREFDDTIRLDNIKPDEIINQNNIGSYLPRLQKADVVCMRSNMMTYKTENLKELMSVYKRILVVSFRISLEDEYMTKFAEHDFKLYSDFKGLITGDRLITQIDSLYKVRGSFDIIVFDEMVYTINHLNSFAKRKLEVWDALNQYIENTPKIICCDALLDKKTIQLFENNNRTMHVVENNWKSFDSKKVKYLDFIDTQRTIKHILNQLEEWGSLYIPTNSKTFADKLFLYLRNKGVRVGLDSSDNEPTPTNEWRQKFDVFITTPTNVAGVSCNDSFGKTIAYLTSSSCSAEMSSQMLFRVRNVDCDTYDIFIKTGSGGRNYPLNTKQVKQWIKDKDDLIINSGLKIDHIRNDIVQDDYYKLYVQYIKKENLSKVMFKQVLKGILEVHGLEEIIEEEEEEEKKSIQEVLQDEKELNAIKNDSKESHELEKKRLREKVCQARPLTDEEFAKIDEKYRKSVEEKLAIRRYHIEKTYLAHGNNIELNEEFVKKYEGLTAQYRNLTTMNCDNLGEYIETVINKHEKEHKRDDNTKRLHEKHSLLKVWAVDNLLKTVGFDNIWDTKTITGFPYQKVIDFMKIHGGHISTLFGTRNLNWENIEAGNKEIVKYINHKLKSVCHIGVRNQCKGRGKQKQEYTIQGLDFWDKGGIVIPKNEQAQRMIMNRKFKRIMTKTQVGSKMWKCISELVEVK